MEQELSPAAEAGPRPVRKWRRLLLVILTIIEEAVVGLFHHRSIAASLGDLFGARLEETLAGYLIMLLVLVPYFAFQVLDDALGKGRLVRMFFVEREPMTPK